MAVSPLDIAKVQGAYCGLADVQDNLTAILNSLPKSVSAATRDKLARQVIRLAHIEETVRHASTLLAEGSK